MRISPSSTRTHHPSLHLIQLTDLHATLLPSPHRPPSTWPRFPHRPPSPRPCCAEGRLGGPEQVTVRAGQGRGGFARRPEKHRWDAQLTTQEGRGRATTCQPEKRQGRGGAAHCVGDREEAPVQQLQPARRAPREWVAGDGVDDGNGARISVSWTGRRKVRLG